MYVLWKLVVVAIIAAGSSRGSDPDSIEDLNKEEARQRTFLSNADIIADSKKFQCRHKQSGYYADPRFDCKVFHYCHEDGTKVTIPCLSNAEEHKICIFKDIAFNACEGSEIYLALPEDLHVKTPKETTDSAIYSATDFKLPNVLPQPSSETNHSTTPLSLNLETKEKSNLLVNSRDDLGGSIFEVFNSVLREIQAGDVKSISPSIKEFKLSPSTFSRGSKLQAPTIQTDDSQETLENKDKSYLLEVSHKNDGKISNENSPEIKKSKRLFFLPKLEKKTPAVYPRRKKRTVAEELNVRRPYAVIYAKVSDGNRASNTKIGKRTASQRRDIIEVPFVPARVPIDVPTIPIAIETRRKKKNKSKKVKTSPQTINSHEVKGQEQLSEQKNVLIFAPEQASNTHDLEGLHNSGITDIQQIPQQNVVETKQIEAQFNNNQETPQNPLQQSYQGLLDQEITPLQIPIPNFPFQPTHFLANSATPQIYLTSQNFQQLENLPTFNFNDQFSLQPNQPASLQSNSFQQPEVSQSQPVSHSEHQNQAIQPENSSQQRVPFQTLVQPQVSQPEIPRQPESSILERRPNITPQILVQSQNIHQTIRPADNSPQHIRQSENIPTQNYNQPEFPPFTFNQPDFGVQSLRHAGGVLPNFHQPQGRHPQTSQQPQSLLPQAFMLPENAQDQTIRQPENTRVQSFRQQENIPSQAVRQPENIPVQTLRHPDNIQSQAIRQPENTPIQTLRHPDNIQSHAIRQPENTQIQTLRHPDNIQSQAISQPENIPSHAIRHPENIQLQAQGVRQPESIPSQVLRRPGVLQPQSIRQLQNAYIPNLQQFFNQPGSILQTIRQPQQDQPQLLQNTNTQDERDKNERDRPQRPQQNTPSQRFPGFESPFFQEFPNFGSLPFNGPFSQNRPYSYDLFAPPAIRFPEQTNSQQSPNNAERSPQRPPQKVENPQDQVVPHIILSERPRNPNQQENGNYIRHQIPQAHQVPFNQPGSNVVYQQQPNHIPNVIEAEREKQERIKPTRENGLPHAPIADPESPRPSRNRGRQPPATEAPVRQPVRHRNRDPNSQDAHHQNSRRPQENSLLYGRPHQESHPSNYNRRPTESPRPTPEISYRPQNQPEVSETPNEIRYHHPSTPADSNFRLQEHTPSQNVRENTRDSSSRQRQPTSHRNRQYYHDSNNGQTLPQYTPTTPASVPSSSRLRTRQPEHYSNRNIYQQNPRQNNKELANEAGEKPSYDYRTPPSTNERSRTRTSTTRQQQGLPVTNRYFVTSAPRFRPTEGETNVRRPQHDAETHYERPRTRPQAQIERPPSDHVSVEHQKEEYPKPQRYISNRPQNINVENDVNVVSTAEDPHNRHQTTPSENERRPGYRRPSHNRHVSTTYNRLNPEIEHGFLPVSERPPRQRAYTTRAPEREYSYTTASPEKVYSRTPERERAYAPRAPERERSYTTASPDRGYSRTPERDRAYAPRAPERERSQAPRAPERERSQAARVPERERSQAPRVAERERSHATRPPTREYSYTTRSPDREYSYTTRSPDREYSYTTRSSEREYSYATRAPEREYSYATRAPEREYSYATRAPERERSYATKAPERDYSYSTRAPEREYSYTTRAPEREYSYSTRNPERDYSYSSHAPHREYSYSTQTSERENREPVNERTRGHRYPNNNEEISTTRLVTTPRPTKKQRPPPPRPTFPPFPTFPPPPRRTVPPPRPKSTEPPEESPEATEYVQENPVTSTTEQPIRRQRLRAEVITEESEPKYATENYLQTDAPEVTTRRRTRKRRPKPRRPKVTTTYPGENDDAIQVESVTQATTHKEVTTRSTPSNFNRWRKQTLPQPKSTSTTPSTTSKSEAAARTEEYGSRINLFGRPRTRKPSSFAPKTPTTTPASYEHKRVTKTPSASRTRKPFAKKVKKRPVTTTEIPETSDVIARSDEDVDSLHYHTDVKLQELESVTQLSVENMEGFQTTEAYNDDVETTTEAFTESYQEETLSDNKDKSEDIDGTRSLANKFQNRGRILKFGKPRLRPTDLPLDLNAAESKNLR